MRVAVSRFVAFCAAFFSAAALPCSVRAQDAPRLSERLGLEGPLDNDTRVPTNQPAQDEIARGDAELEKGRGDVGHRTAAFEAWRRALTISSVLDVVEERDGALASVSQAVRRRIVDLDRQEFTARFAGAAQVALDAAGDDLAALERVTHENPFTTAGARASLRRCDLWIERGERARARAALESAVDVDANVAAARAKRLEFLGFRAPTTPSAPAQPSPTSLILARTLEMPAVTDADLARRLEPGVVFADDATRAWIVAGERLVRVDDDERVTSYELDALAKPLHAAWLPAFGDRTRAWSQTPALDRDRLVVVAGRAREERGNALLALDVDGVVPTVRWAWSDSGFADRDGARAAASDALLPGRLEFQPGPLLTDDLVIVHVLQWTQAGVPEPAQRVDETDTTAWLVAFDATSGRVAWRRELARGADTSARDASRMSEPRRVSTASLPLARVDDVVLAVTELGTCSLVRAGDGAWLAGRRLKRAPKTPGETLPIVRGGIVSGSDLGPDGGRRARFAFVASDSGAVEYVVRANTVSPRRVDGILRPVAVNGVAVNGVAVGGVAVGGAAIVRRDDRTGLIGTSSTSTDADRARTVAALPFARGAGLRGVTSSDRGILCASGDEVLVYDPRRDLMRTARLVLDGLDEEPFCGLQCRAARVYVVGLRRTWILELR